MIKHNLEHTERSLNLKSMTEGKATMEVAYKDTEKLMGDFWMFSLFLKVIRNHYKLLRI